MTLQTYFDYAASSPISPPVIEAMPELFSEFYANPGSPHKLGKQSKDKMTEARQKIADIVGCSPNKIYFTSGATEAANILLKGYCAHLKRRKSSANEIIISPFEHPAVHQTAHELQKQGWTIHHAPIDRNGLVDLKSLMQLVNERTAIVSIMAVNNETGTIQDIHQIAQCVKESNPNTFFVSDAVQGFGKNFTTLNLDNIDSFFVAGHKIGAPKGIGFFYLNSKFRVMPLVHGGEQEQGYRPGTDDPVLPTLLSLALEDKAKHLDDNLAKVNHLKALLIGTLQELSVNFSETIDAKHASPYVFSLIFPDIKGKHLVEKLSEKGYCISAGSACSSQSHTKSRIIEALGVDENLISSVVRVSFSPLQTENDVKQLARAFQSVLNVKESR